MSDCTVITSVYGAYDTVVDPPKQSMDVRFICVADRPLELQGWEVIVEPRPGCADRLAAKVAKCVPEIYTNDHRTIWMDAACRLTGEESVETLLAWSENEPIAQFAHPHRECCLQEADASVGISKYSHQNLMGQKQHYFDDGMPERWGLWCTGLIVRNHWRPEWPDGIRREVGQDWLVEQMRWTDQDQVSEAYILHRYDVRPFTLAGNIYGNPAINWEYSNRDWS